VGANIGYFSSMAASRGCDTHAFEPQGATSTCVHVSACMNGWAPDEQRAEGRLSVHKVPVSPHKTLSFPPGAAGNTGGVSADYCRLHPEGCAQQSTVQLDAVFGTLLRGPAAYGSGEEPILVLKTDIEGYDIEAVETAKRLIAAHAIANVVLELTPGGGKAGSAGADGVKLGVEHNTRMLKYLQEHGYTLAQLPFQTEDPKHRTKPCQAIRVDDAEELVRRCSQKKCRGLDGEERWHTDVWAAIDPTAHKRFTRNSAKAFRRAAKGAGHYH